MWRNSYFRFLLEECSFFSLEKKNKNYYDKKKLNKVFFWEESLLSSQYNPEYSFGRIPYLKQTYQKDYCFCPSPKNEYSFYDDDDIFFVVRRSVGRKLDQYQYLGNCPPIPPLTQH